MLNYIWIFMVIFGIIYGSLTGQMAQISNGVIDSSKEAVQLCITMLGVVALWSGLMEIAREAGLVDSMTRGLKPIMKFLFPKLPENHEAFSYISLNTIANILGLGWAATPAGLKAMESLANLEKDRGNKEGFASNEMCTFLVLNISSLQLIPVNMIAYRSQYGSVNPAGIIMPAIVATLISTMAGVVFCRIMRHKKVNYD